MTKNQQAQEEQGQQLVAGGEQEYQISKA